MHCLLALPSLKLAPIYAQLQCIASNNISALQIAVASPQIETTKQGYYAPGSCLFVGMFAMFAV